MDNTAQVLLDGKQYTITITPLAVPTSTEPSFLSTDTLIHFDDFSSYKDTASFKNAYILESGGDTGLFLDPTGGMGGKAAMRIDWLASAGCQDAGHLIEMSPTPVPNKDHYVQFVVKYQKGFVFDWNYSNQHPCVGNAKKLFLAGGVVGDRFDFICENHIIHMGRDAQPLLNQNLNTAVTPELYGDGNWHRVTLRIRQSTSLTATDGILEGWIDGIQRWKYSSWQSGSTGGFYYFRMPATFNQGSPVNQSEWMDSWRIWAR